MTGSEVVTLVGSVCALTGTLATQYVVYYQIKQNHARTVQKLEAVHQDVNGRMDQLVVEARKNGALEAIQPSDVDEFGM